MNGLVLGILLNNMNYFITVSDENFTKVAEKLFDSLKENSQYKILYFTVNFKYKNKINYKKGVNFFIKWYKKYYQL